MNSSFGTGGNNSTSNPNNSSNVVSTPRSSRFNNAAAAAEPNDGIDGDGGDTGRGRSHTDPAHLLNIKYAIEEMADPTHPYKQRLYQLFSLIEREMEALHLENSTLRARLEIQSGGGDRMMGNEAETPLRRDFTAQLNETFQSLGMGSNGFEHKSAKKSTQSRQQKWKSAFKNPSGKLALKVGANFPESKHKFVQSFKGHTDGVWHVCTAQLPDGAHVLASASADQTVKIWLSGSGAQPLASYSGHTGSVNSVAIRPEGAAGAYPSAGMYGSQLTMLTCSGDRTAHIWRLNMDQISERRREAGTENDEPQFVQPVLQPLLKLNGHSDPVMAGDWLYGGQQIITVSWDRTANLFDAESGKVLKTLSGHDQELTSCSAHPSQKLLATASRDYTFRLWDFREPIHSVAVFQGHNDSVTSVVFSTLHHIVSGSDDRTVKVWDLRNMRSPTSAIRLDSAANRIAICNSKNLLAIPLDNRNISIYDLNGNRQARIPRSTGKCHHRLVSACAWLSDHPLNNLITCGFDKQIIGWRVQLPGSTGAKS